MRSWLFHGGSRAWKASLGLLLLRLASGVLMIVLHGWRKFETYGDGASEFWHPPGVSPEVSMALTIFAEVFCAGLVALGLLTRWAAAVGMFTMIIAAFVVHSNDPLSKQELALMYLAMYGALIAMGPGRFSIDHFITRDRAS